METKEYVDELDSLINQVEKAIEKLETAKKELNTVLEGMAKDGDLIKCQACGEYVSEDHIVDFYGEDICLDCRGNGYGK